MVFEIYPAFGKVIGVSASTTAAATTTATNTTKERPYVGLRYVRYFFR